MNKKNRAIYRLLVIFMLLALAVSACVPAAPSPASGESGAQSADAGPDSPSAAGMHNVVYDRPAGHGGRRGGGGDG